MKGLSKILVIVAVLCALGYTFHRFQSCQIVGANPDKQAAASIPAPVQPTQPMATVSSADPLLVYPSHAALVSMKLGYEVAHANSDGSIMALPLPPGLAFQTTIMLSPAGHHHLSVTVPNEKCASGIEVNAYRLDQESPVYSGNIAPVSKRAPLMMDLETSKVSDPFIVTVKLAQGAQNNWFCNVTMSWDRAE